MQTVLIVVHLMIVIALVGVVLIQRSEGGGLGIGGGSGLMSARGTANALTRTTAILAALFFLTSLGLGIMTRFEAKPTDILDRISGGKAAPSGNILDQLPGAATTPAQPAGQAPAQPANGTPSAAPQASQPAQQPGAVPTGN